MSEVMRYSHETTPDFSQWLRELNSIPEDQKVAKPTDITKAYSIARVVFDPLSDNPRLDYYEPYRAAYVLSLMFDIPRTYHYADAAFAGWMAKQKEIQMIETKHMGREISFGMIELKDDLLIPETVSYYLSEILKDVKHMEIYSSSAEMIRRWREENPTAPFETYYGDYMESPG